MTTSKLFIQRPVMTTLVMLSILLAGVIGYRLLPVSDLPNVDRATIQVNASLAGANPDTMASSVATVLEKEFSGIAGLDSMSSSSSKGSTSITLQFVLGRNIDAAAQDVQAAIAHAQRKLPSEMSDPPSYRKVNPADQPILFLTLTSPTMEMSDLDELGETMMAQQISMVSGVAQVQVFGAQKYAVRIQLDPRELAARKIGIDEVAKAISNNNVNAPLGSLSGPDKTASIQSNGQLTDAEQYRPLIVTYRNGKPVRLKDLGVVKDDVENDQQAAWYGRDGKIDRSIILAVFKQPGVNTVEVADGVKGLLPAFREKLPGNVTLDIMRDGSVSIRDSANDVQFTLLLTLGLVVMVIFLFLRNVSATVIPSLTLPMSIVGTFAVMYLLGYSLDNLSLMALTLSVGFVVDDAIVMLENIVRHMEMGKTRMQAAFDGAKEIGFTIVSMTLSLAAVFIPVLFMSGIVGRLFREFSVTIGVAVIVSGVVSLTLTPMLCSRFLKDPRRVHRGMAYKVTEWGFELIRRFYDWSLRKALKHRLATVTVAVAVLGGTVYLATIVPMGFIPSEDREQLSVQTEAAQDVSYDAMVRHHESLARILSGNPDIQSYMNSVGGGNTGRLFVTLRPRTERKDRHTIDEVIAQLRQELGREPGIKVYVTNPPPINVGGRQSRSLYQVTLQGPDTTELYAYSEKLLEQVRGLDEFQDVSTDLQMKNPQLYLTIDRDKAASTNVSLSALSAALGSAFANQQVSTIYAPNNAYAVVMELKPEFQKDEQALAMLYVRSSSGALVPLSNLMKREETVGPLSVNHSGQMPSVTLSFNLKPGVSLGQAMETLKTMTVGTMPAGITMTPQGTAQEFQKSVSSMGILLALAVVVIYIVLGILYESFYHPITILSALPFAGFGALLTLLVFNCELSIYAFVGIIMLVGLVKKNGIMMVDFAIEAQRTEGKNATDAIHEACVIRFRPIMMTTMAALMAGLPIAMGYGAGAESRRPLGLAVVGGLLFSQTLTLYVTPVFYVYMERLRQFIHRGKQALPPPLPGKAQLEAVEADDIAR